MKIDQNQVNDVSNDILSKLDSKIKNVITEHEKKKTEPIICILGVVQASANNLMHHYFSLQKIQNKDIREGKAEFLKTMEKAYDLHLDFYFKKSAQ